MRVGLPWRLTRFGGLTNTLIRRPLRRAALRRRLQRAGSRPDVTVVIPLRNRSGAAIENTLRAVRRQTYPRNLVHLALVDYNSDEIHAAWLSSAAVRYEAT